jgi:hypothetical protein
MKPAKHQFLESQEQVQENPLVDELVRRFLIDFQKNNWFDSL